MIARPIVADSTNDGRAQPADIIFQNLESFTVAVASNDNSPVLHELREIRRFAARCRTRAEDSFSWLRIEKLTGDCCAGVLIVAMTRTEGGLCNAFEIYKIWVGR